MVNVIVLTTSGHGVFPKAVSVKSTFPAAQSAGEGVYIGFNVLPPVNVPVPEVVQFREL